MARTGSWSNLWIIDERTARRAASPAIFACAMPAALKVVHFLAALADPSRVASPVELVDAALFALAAFGTYHLSRSAATAGFALYLAAAALSGTAELWAFALFTAFFVGGILATVVYHNLQRQADGTVA